MEAYHFIYLFTGLFLGGSVSWFIAKAKFESGVNSEDTLKAKELEMQLKMEQERSVSLGKDIATINTELRTERDKGLHLSNQYARLETEHKNLQETLKTQKGELNEIKEKFSAEFKNLANEIFEEKSKRFTDQNKLQVGELLKPLGEKILEFEKKVDQTNKDSNAWNLTLKHQIDDLKGANVKMTKEAENLVKALKGDSKTQGNWGEMQLEGILNKVGLEREVHYSREKNFKNEDGNNQRLDFIVNLPDGKSIVIDSKVSLTAYARYFEETEEIRKAHYLREHIDSVNSHIKILGSKDYQNLYEINQPDYVMLFVANEPALTIALQEDQGLYEKALEKNIVLVSTSTLMATLRTVSFIWKQDTQSKNAIEIARQGGALYDKFVSFVEDIKKVGAQLDLTQKVYRESAKKLYDGTGNLINRAEKLKNMGAKATKVMDQKLIERAGD
ncbi:DNA recombination protein RmuC [Reichenbachiella agarivorans]|uniref:DNA recombination protein RmuC n=1 Tax=Reichenbachiella agarivorans TaxID=2979464 RepID=A0ABY6CKK1_9BACT|nr:DNA recombination protein RmuC [Reichenbachiella agarivorans]UXP30610.1 DNA recombination protein RmuC [Reichenbachiella agarivorans]